MPTVSRATTVTAASSPTPAAAAKTWAEGFNFGSTAAVKRLAVPRSQAATTGSPTLQRAYTFYRAWEDNDLGSVRLIKTNAGGKPGFALHTTTDGDTGFLELYGEKGTLLASGTTGFDAQGKQQITWDTKPGAVRERVSPKNGSASITAFTKAIDDAVKSTSPSGSTISKAELVDAAKHLVGAELTSRSVDGREKASLLRSLTESKLNTSSRAYGESLAALYTDAPKTTFTGFTLAPLGTDTDFKKTARLSGAKIAASNAPPKANTMIALALKAFNELPAQLAPVTRTEAQALLKAAGATTAEAKAAVDALADAKGQLYAGKTFVQGSGTVPQEKGLVLFGVTSTGRELKALNVPGKAPPPPVGPDARAVIKRLTGADREVEVTATRTTPTGTQQDLVWRPPTGGTITAKLNVPSNGTEPTVEGLTMPSVIGLTETMLGDRISAATGVPQKGLSYAQSGSDWLVAHRPAAGGPIRLSLVKVAIGGATASVTPASIGTGSAQLEVARMLSLGLARQHIEGIVSGPGMSDGERLEVALKTRWATFADMTTVTRDESPVGIDPTNDRVQFKLSRVWGDNALFVTFGKAGGARVEDFN
ncbi:MAG: hypothetical protein JNK82_14035 [Myxococcaceae bacterium]|nr:hypothetical protein [Myxococcaceae bacterium]